MGVDAKGRSQLWDVKRQAEGSKKVGLGIEVSWVGYNWDMGLSFLSLRYEGATFIL